MRAERERVCALLRLGQSKLGRERTAASGINVVGFAVRDGGEVQRRGGVVVCGGGRRREDGSRK